MVFPGNVEGPWEVVDLLIRLQPFQELSIDRVIRPDNVSVLAAVALDQLPFHHVAGHVFDRLVDRFWRLNFVGTYAKRLS